MNTNHCQGSTTHPDCRREHLSINPDSGTEVIIITNQGKHFCQRTLLSEYVTKTLTTTHPLQA